MKRLLKIVQINLLLCMILISTEIFSTETKDHASNFAIETDLVWPVMPTVHIFRFKGIYSLFYNQNERTAEILAGVYIRPRVEHDVVETIDEYLVSIGYRHYIYSGLHLESNIYTGWAWGWDNKKDGKDYSNPSVLMEIVSGYRFDINNSIYVIPQAGVLFGLYTDIGPRDEPDFFYTGNLVIGYSF